MKRVYALLAFLLLGSVCAQLLGEDSLVNDENAIAQTLDALVTGIRNEDVTQILSAYSDDYQDPQGSDKASRTDYFKGLFALGVFKNAEFRMDDMTIRIQGDRASAEPVTYVTGAGTARYRYEFRKEQLGWRITSSGQLPSRSSVSPDDVSSTPLISSAAPEFLGHAGRLVDRHAMLWVRRLDASVEKVWELISTKEGLSKWWIVPPSEFDLRPGGAFKHHWQNTVTGFEPLNYIDFTENTGNYHGTGGMRFELQKVDANTTLFLFMDTWGPEMVSGGGGIDGEQPGGPGTPWPGVAAGWHNMVDKLVATVHGDDQPHTMEELTRYYVGYLRDYYRWSDMVKRPE